MKQLTNLSLILIVILLGCSSEPRKPPDISAMDNTAAVQALADYAITGDILEVTVNDDVPALTIRFDMMANNISVAHNNMGKALCVIRQSGRFDGYLMQFRAKGQLQDSLGNPVDADGIKARITADTINRINCENDGYGIIWENAAETYFLHPALQE